MKQWDHAGGRGTSEMDRVVTRTGYIHHITSTLSSQDMGRGAVQLLPLSLHQNNTTEGNLWLACLLSQMCHSSSYFLVGLIVLRKYWRRKVGWYFCGAVIWVCQLLRNSIWIQSNPDSNPPVQRGLSNPDSNLDWSRLHLPELGSNPGRTARVNGAYEIGTDLLPSLVPTSWYPPVYPVHV